MRRGNSAYHSVHMHQTQRLSSLAQTRTRVKAQQSSLAAHSFRLLVSSLSYHTPLSNSSSRFPHRSLNCFHASFPILSTAVLLRTPHEFLGCRVMASGDIEDRCTRDVQRVKPGHHH